MIFLKKRPRSRGMMPSENLSGSQAVAISAEDGGRYLNEGLIAQKEGFGGRTVVYETYELDAAGEREL